MNEQSENINELVKALANIQSKIQPALKDQDNPYFKSKYADLSSVWSVCREHLGPAGLVVVQTMDYQADKSFLVTTLAHTSGQYIKSRLHLACKDPSDPQKLGSSITYMRRYSLAAILGITTDEDDDANKATIPPKETKKPEIKDLDKKEIHQFLKDNNIEKEDMSQAFDFLSKEASLKNKLIKDRVDFYKETQDFQPKFLQWKMNINQMPNPKTIKLASE